MSFNRQDKNTQLRNIREWSESRAIMFARFAGEAQALSQLFASMAVWGMDESEAAKRMLARPDDFGANEQTDLEAVRMDAYRNALERYADAK